MSTELTMPEPKIVTVTGYDTLLVALPSNQFCLSVKDVAAVVYDRANAVLLRDALTKAIGDTYD